MNLFSVALALLLICLSLIVWIFLGRKRFLAKSTPVPCPTMLIMGSGGHTTEMLTIAKALDTSLYSPRIYVVAHSDRLSPIKVVQMEEARGESSDKFCVETVHRVREVGQSWSSTVLISLPVALKQSADIFRRHSPAIVLSNGPGICVLFCLIAVLSRSVFHSKCALVYVESICRVQCLSLTGKILRHVVDYFVIQWPELGVKGGNVHCFGRIS